MPTAGYNLTEILKVGNGVYFFRTCKANFSRKLKMSELLLLKIKGILAIYHTNGQDPWVYLLCQY